MAGSQAGLGQVKKARGPLMQRDTPLFRGAAVALRCFLMAIPPAGLTWYSVAIAV